MSGLDYLRSENAILVGAETGGTASFRSTVTLKRNLMEAFPGNLGPEGRRGLRARLFESMAELPSLEGAAFLCLEDLEPYELAYLHERRLIGFESLSRPQGRGLIITRDSKRSILVGEEDHLHIQCQVPGPALDDAYVCADNLDAELEERFRFAFSEEFGYLTSCPSEAGTGLRASMLLHLPALALQGDVPKIIRGLAALKVAIRGPFADDRGSPSDWVLISNSRSLGKAERDFVEGLDRVGQKLLDFEDRALDRSMGEAQSLLEDEVDRALEALGEIEEVTGPQSLALLGTLRMGSRAGLVNQPEKSRLGPLEFWVQAGHLQMLEGGALDESERNRLRASRLKDWLFN